MKFLPKIGSQTATELTSRVGIDRYEPNNLTHRCMINIEFLLNCIHRWENK